MDFSLFWENLTVCVRLGMHQRAGWLCFGRRCATVREPWVIKKGTCNILLNGLLRLKTAGITRHESPSFGRRLRASKGTASEPSVIKKGTCPILLNGLLRLKTAGINRPESPSFGRGLRARKASKGLAAGIKRASPGICKYYQTVKPARAKTFFFTVCSGKKIAAS